MVKAMATILLLKSFQVSCNAIGFVFSSYKIIEVIL